MLSYIFTFSLLFLESTLINQNITSFCVNVFEVDSIMCRSRTESIICYDSRHDEICCSEEYICFSDSFCLIQKLCCVDEDKNTCITLFTSLHSFFLTALSVST